MNEGLGELRVSQTLFFLYKKTSDDKLPEVFACMKKVNGCKHQIRVVAIWHATY